MQCFGDPKQPRRMCACYDQEYDQIKAPSRQLKSCNCLAEHHEKSKSTHNTAYRQLPNLALGATRPNVKNYVKKKKKKILKANLPAFWYCK
ncbi:hypothetical protein IscW_ISCW024702 [Ixodes scapularis]|uniref:Uncharacterized protein n=1 Tax=Ixodes scapularis TaxID=6945 RepID=B7Q3U6_IXOSC|nr:hypothetical protein IscW_ISCW024702 [Ixodes scapularis]|eukprot:XP_002411392.1 hypothetical protein IscW_ISCW024702 [Ixodes scapularis]